MGVMEMHKFQVGEPAPSPFWPVTGIKERSIMEMGSDGALWIALYLGDVTREEQNIYRDKPLEARYIEKDGNLITLMCPLGTDMVSELYFDPSKYSWWTDNKENILKNVGSSLIMMLVIDIAKNGAVQVVRTFTPPPQLALVWDRIWNIGSLEKPSFVAECLNIPIMDLWNKATKAGFFGGKQ